MRIAVFSDSHHRLTHMRQVLSLVARDVDAVIHLGDCVDDAMQMEVEFPGPTYYRVCGNGDFINKDSLERRLYLGGVTVLVTHGHRYSVKSGLDRLSALADEQGFRLCLFGHTHESAIARTPGGLYLMNPGSISLPRAASYPTYGIVTLGNGTMDLAVVGKKALNVNVNAGGTWRPIMTEAVPLPDTQS